MTIGGAVGKLYFHVQKGDQHGAGDADSLMGLTRHICNAEEDLSAVSM